jgi:hypothetical protein
MSFLEVPEVRVGYMAPRLPYPVQVYLPPVSARETRAHARTTGPNLDIIVPQDPSRHEKLGRFMDAWGKLEAQLTFLLMHLTPLRLSDADLIVPKLGMRNALDLLDSLGRRKLDNDSAAVFTNLLERASKLNTKRNILVHGRWVLEANVIVRRGEACLALQFLREITPVDPTHEKAMANPRNQKERVRYSFTLKRIDAVTRDTNAITVDISNFIGTMKQKVVSASEIGHELILGRPYRVTYQSPPECPSPTQPNPKAPRAPDHGSK